MSDAVRTTRTVDEYLRLPYRIEVTREEDCWAARIPELPGLVAAHETWEGLGTKLQDAMRTWMESAIEDDEPIPEPTAGREIA